MIPMKEMIMLIALVIQVIPEKAVTRQAGNDAGHY
jgi:hypothetical protein